MMRALLVALATAGITVGALAPRVARASDAPETLPTTIGVSPFLGAKPQSTRRAVMESLARSRGVTVVDVASSQSATPEELIAQAADEGVDAILFGKVAWDRGGLELELILKHGRTGEVIKEFKVVGKNTSHLQDQIAGAVPVELSEALIGLTEHPPPAETERATDPPARQPTRRRERSASPAEVPQTVLTLGVRGLVYRRDFAYRDEAGRLRQGSTVSDDPIADPLRAYEMPAAPAAGVEAEWFPFAGSSRGALADVGVSGRYASGFLTTTEFASSKELKTTTDAWEISPLLRIPLGKHRLLIGAGYGQHSFEVAGEEPAVAGRPGDPLFPDVSYGHLFGRAAFDLRGESWLAGVELRALRLVSFGQLEGDDWFPRASGGGFAGDAYFGLPIGDAFELAAGVGIVRYGMTLHSKVADVSVAGGAWDRYLSGYLRATYVLRPTVD